MQPQSIHSPASRALAALFAADDGMPESCHAVALFDRPNIVVVLLDSAEAWAAWVVAVQELTGDHVCAQAGIHVATAEAVVCGCPVMVLRGELPEQVMAA